MTEARKSTRKRAGKAKRPKQSSPRPKAAKAGKKQAVATARETAPQPAEERLVRAQAIAHVGDWEWDLATDTLHWSDELYRIYGFEPRSTEPDYDLVLQQIHPEDKHVFLKAIDAAIKEDRRFELDHRFFRKDGTEAVVHAIGQVVRDASGAPVRMLGIVQDITERKRIEEQLQASEEKYRLLVETANSVILTWDTSGNILFVNDYCERFFGFARRELIGRNVVGTIVPETESSGRDLALLMRKIQKDPDSFKDNENENVTKDGRRVWIRWANKAVMDRAGRLTGILSVGNDITGRKRVELELAERGALLQQIMDTANVGISFVDGAGRFTHVNKHMADLFGCPVNELVGSEYVDHVHPAEREIARKSVFALLKSAVPAAELDRRYRRKDGTEFWGHLTCNRFYDARGNNIGLIGAITDITEQKKAYAALRESEKRLRTLIDAIPDMVFFKDVAGRHVIDNKASETLLGVSPETLAGKTAEDLMPPESAAVCRRNDEEVMRTGETVRCEEQTTDKRGMKRVIDTIRVPLYDDDGNAVGLVGVIRDITEQKQAEARLRESEDRFRSIFEHATDGIMIADPVRKQHIEANQTMCAMLGYTRDELVGLRVEDIHPKADLPRVLKLFERQMRGEISLAPDVPMVRKDGSVIYVDINSSAVSLGGKPCLLGIFRDITERKRSDEALQARERQLAESQTVAKLGSWDLDLVTKRLDWSDETFVLFDKSRKEFVPSFGEFARLVHPDDRETMQTKFNNALKSDDAPYHAAVRIINDSGREWVMEAFGRVRRDGNGGPLSIFGTAQDITERTHAEEKVRQNEEFIRSMLDTVDEGFIVIDRDYRIVTANKAYCAQAGLPCDKVIGSHCFEISHRTLRPCYEEGEDCSVRHVFATGEPHAVLHKHLDRDGQVLYVETKAFPIRDASGTVVSAIETINNITEKHLLEEERLKTQKLESIGTLAGGIAHDFNNLLQGVFGYISMAKLSAQDRAKCAASLDEAEKALHLAVKLTNQLLTFSKGGKPVKRPTDLRPVITGAVQFALSGSRSTSSFEAGDDLWHAEVDDGQISQVVQNIVLNADQAMPLGGTVGITARNAVAPGSDVPPQLPAGKYVKIVISDTGIGIPEQYLAKIFDPYFTTKEKGSGLGLATAYSIIRNHGGALDVRSEVGKGSTFLLYLPAASPVPASAAPSSEPAAGRHGRVLLMDDEELVRRVSGELLGGLGHEVDFARDGEEAIGKYRAALDAGKPFDVVILDLTVRGGMGGAEAARKLREMDSAAKTVVSSGYSDDAVIAEYREHGFSAFLKKPYSLEDLSSIMNELLA